MNTWLVPSLMVLCLWRISVIPDAYAAIRVIRTAKNLSKFIHHAWEEEFTTLESTETDLCMNETTEEEEIQRQRRSDDVDVVQILKETNVTASIADAEYSQEFIDCGGHSVVEKGCYEKLLNGSVYVPLYERLFNTTDYVIQEKGDLYVCPLFFDEFTDDTKFSSSLAIVTVVGTAISTFCIVLHVAMFLTFEKLRNLPGYSLFSLCIALLIAYICTYIPHNREEDSTCTAIGAIKAYAFLASFFWMNVMSYDIWRSLRMATAKLRLTGDRPMFTRFAIYSAYSWVTPLLILLFGFIVNSADGDEKYQLLMDKDTCWFRYKQALLVYFAIPLFSLLFINVLLFISSFCMINSATMNTAENKADLWARFLVSVRLAVVMGLMWIFGVLATATEAQWLWYLNVICNVLQGVFIFFSFTFTEKTRKECRKAIARKKSSVFPTLTSSRQSTSV